jgi:hypothetical protein
MNIYYKFVIHVDLIKIILKNLVSLVEAIILAWVVLLYLLWIIC